VEGRLLASLRLLRRTTLRKVSKYSESVRREARCEIVRICRVTAGRQWVSKDGLKLITEVSEVHSWASYLFIDSVTCRNLLLHSTLAFSMHGLINHEGAKHVDVDRRCESSPERGEKWPHKSQRCDFTKPYGDAMKSRESQS
jgi:hypothetical protein